MFLRSVELKRGKVPSFDEFPFSLPVVRALDTIEFTTNVTFFVGENGSGKSTLLEGIAVKWGYNFEGGSRNFAFENDYDKPGLHQYLALTRDPYLPRDGFFLRAESFYNVATEIDRLGVTRGYGGKSLHEQSHGEAFMALLLNRFHDRGLYILDEPEAALSPTRQLAALVRIHDLAESGSQLIIATHSPILMAVPGATILALDGGELKEVAYEETEHVSITRRFLNQRERMLRELLG